MSQSSLLFQIMLRAVWPCLLFAFGKAAAQPPGNAKTHLIIFLGKTQQRHLESFIEALYKMDKEGKYLPSMVMYEEKIGYSKDEHNVYLGRALVEAEPEAIAKLQKWTDDLPGLRMFERPVHGFQVTVTLELVGEGLPILTLGEASSLVPVDQCDLRRPQSCLFVKNGKIFCNRMDAECLAYLAGEGFLEGKLRFPTETKQVGAIGLKEVLRKLFLHQPRVLHGLKLHFLNARMVDPGEETGLEEASVSYRSLSQRMDMVQDPSNRYLLALPVNPLRPVEAHFKRGASLESYYRALTPTRGANH